MLETASAGSLLKTAGLAETHKLWPQWQAQGNAQLPATRTAKGLPAPRPSNFGTAAAFRPSSRRWPRVLRWRVSVTAEFYAFIASSPYK